MGSEIIMGPFGRRRRCLLVATAVAAFPMSGCEKAPDATATRSTDSAVRVSAPVTRRWYTQAQVDAGAPLYRENCAACHKENAEGTPNWRERDANGNFPPPPLNGTAHAWHHPLKILRSVVKAGGVPVGGSMPAFGQKLDAEQVDAILAWVQSHWSAEIYAMWHERDAQASAPLNRVPQG